MLAASGHQDIRALKTSSGDEAKAQKGDVTDQGHTDCVVAGPRLESRFPNPHVIQAFIHSLIHSFIRHTPTTPPTGSRLWENHQTQAPKGSQTSAGDGKRVKSAVGTDTGPPPLVHSHLHSRPVWAPIVCTKVLLLFP